MLVRNVLRYLSVLAGSQRPISLQEIVVEVCIRPVVHVGGHEVVVDGHAVGGRHGRQAGLAGVGRAAGVGLELVDAGRGAGLGRARAQQVVHVDVDGARRVGPRGAQLGLGRRRRAGLARLVRLQRAGGGRLQACSSKYVVLVISER